MTELPHLVVLATHPIQYHAPLFRALAASDRLRVTVAFLDMPDGTSQGAGFGTSFQWDIPLTHGYSWLQLDAVIAKGSRANDFFGRRARGLVGQLARLAPDALLVLGWNQLGLLQGWYAARRLGLPLLVRGDSNAKRVRPAWKRLIHSAMLSVPDCFLSVGISNRRFYRDSGVPAARIVDAPHFVDNVFFAARASAVDRAVQRARWSVGRDDCCVLFAGKFESKKRPSDLLKAVAVVAPRERARIVVLMVGAGPLEADLRAQAKAAGLRLAWAGFLNQTEIPAAYAAADLLVLPSDHGETWGLVVNEAMACSVPAIVSDQVGCAEDLVRSNETGLVIKTGDLSALAEAIEALAKHPERRRAMGVAASRVVHARYTVERCKHAIESAVECLLDGLDPTA